ncbi:hypothetical protein PFTANZ_04469 [Plasmodium falciparum Tanzania (2000708)]|uniref:Uncharacterized protein n=1 Tax=Plasmodium falciparum Tanzania (2000708) TaxID=1036725 RepID=A0A024W2B2_PLAFA|nr:hypothetical protein PFTANZ_04469 [Plasmodium falciparum Tanzania (2000708)]
MNSSVNTEEINRTEKSVNTHIENINMEQKNITHDFIQTDEINCYIKCTQTNDVQRNDKGVVTNMCGVHDFNIKKMMIKNNMLKNKKIQVTPTNMNAYTQTMNTFYNNNNNKKKYIYIYNTNDEYHTDMKYSNKGNRNYSYISSYSNAEQSNITNCKDAEQSNNTNSSHMNHLNHEVVIPNDKLYMNTYTNNINPFDVSIFKEAEIMIEEYRTCLHENKRMNILHDILCNIILCIKNNYDNIHNVFLLFNDDITKSDILNIKYIYKLIDNYSKIDSYIKHINNSCNEKIRNTENNFKEIISNKEDLINIYKENIKNKIQLIEEKDLIIKDLKLEIHILLKDKEITNNLLNELTEEKNTYFNMYMKYHHEWILNKKEIIMKDDKDEYTYTTNDEHNNHKKINNCINQINKLNDEIILLKNKNKTLLHKRDTNKNTSSSVCSHMSSPSPSRISSNSIFHFKQTDNQNVENADPNIIIDNNNSNTKEKKKNSLTNLILKDKNDKLKNFHIKENITSTIHMKKIYKILFLLKEKIILFIFYIYKKIYKNAYINISYIKQFYTQIINIFINIPRYICSSYIFVKENEINYNMYIKNNKNNKIYLHTNHSHILQLTDDNTSLNKQKINEKKKKNQNIKIKKYSHNKRNLYNHNFLENTSIQSSTSPQKKKKNNNLQRAIGKLSDEDSSSNVSLFFDF